MPAQPSTLNAQPEDPQGLLHLTGRYLEHLRVRNFSTDTLYGRDKMLRYFRQFCEQLGLTQARQITRAVVVNYQGYLYHYRKADGTALTIGTQKAWLAAVSSFFSWLTRESLVLFNPASDLDLPRKELRLPKSVLSASEVETVMNVPDIATPLGVRDRAILEVLYSTGIRRSELCHLNRGDLDFDRGVVRIEQGKGNKDRYVPIGERAVKWVEKFLGEVRPRLCPALNEPALFLNTLGTRINPNRLGSQVHEIITAAGIGKKGSCHLLRHTFATLLLENGCDVRYVQEMLGHAKLETTAVYTHVSIRMLRLMHVKYHPAKLPSAATPEAPDTVSPPPGATV